MRTIKFRAKTLYGNKWVCGDLIQQNIEYPRIYNWAAGTDNTINPATIGQYTGINDKNNNEIYEEDIISIHGVAWVVGWDTEDAGFYLFKSNMIGSLDSFLSSEYSIIGNIYDNPELADKILKGE